MRYKGSLKHKRWHPGGGYGTLCPKWTHQAGNRGFSGNTDTHPWQRTEAHEMLEASTLAEDGRRYATKNGIAFVAVNTNDGTWHGYPIPWHDVPDRIRRNFVDQGNVTRRAIRRQTIRADDIRWALSTDDDCRG